MTMQAAISGAPVIVDCTCGRLTLPAASTWNCTVSVPLSPGFPFFASAKHLSTAGRFLPTTDETVPYEASLSLDEGLLQAEKLVEFYTYKGDNHNLSLNLATALQRSVDFFDKYVKDSQP